MGAVSWFVALFLGAAMGGGSFVAACQADTHSQRRALFALAGFLAFGTALGIAFTALFLIAYAGYCEDAGTACAPDWWRSIGVGLLLPTVGFLYLVARSIRGFRGA